jgi:hypothetical protein
MIYMYCLHCMEADWTTGHLLHSPVAPGMLSRHSMAWILPRCLATAVTPIDQATDARCT